MKTVCILIGGMFLGIFLIFFGPTIVAGIAFVLVALGTILAAVFQFGLYVLAGMFACYIVYGAFKCVFERNKNK